MKRSLLLGILSLLGISVVSAQDKTIELKVDAAEQIATVSKLFNGTNIEDLNNQTNGGLFSQLLHGEAFEENIEVDFLNLERKDYSKIYLVLDERRIPHLITQSEIYWGVDWNNREEKYDFNSRCIYDQRPFDFGPRILSGWKFSGRFLVFDSIPEATRKVMLERINGPEQVSKFWSRHVAGSPEWKYTLVRDGQAYMGRQTQRMSFVKGSGEVGITNHGLYRMGIRFDENKPYEGILRLKSEKPITVFLSLRDEHGQTLVERSYHLAGNGSYERLAFELTPQRSTKNGSFCISLKDEGTLDLGFAFLQPGAWGRVAGGAPIRKSFVDALKKQGIRAIRYNGSMVDVSADKYLYRWKRMIGPIDERRVVFRSGFNLYATHSFGFIEMLQAAEAIGAESIIGMSMDETYEDIRDFVEYVNGSTDTYWGRRRAEDGHPAPYNLKYIEVDNERWMTRGYVEGVKKFAQAVWEADQEMTIVTSLNIGVNGYKRGSREYELATELVGWFISQQKGDKLAWDPHYSGAMGFGDNKEWFENEMGVVLQRELAKDYPGFKLGLYPMEENGGRCDWDRGMAHAHNWNTLQRYGDCFRMLGTANTFQPHGLHYMWDQGRIHYNADTLWFQPSAYIDEMMMETWKPNVVKTGSSEEPVLDILAKVNDKRTEMTLYIANLSNQPQKAVLDIDNFRYKSEVEVRTIGGGELMDFNSYEEPERVAFRSSRVKFSGKLPHYTFPKYSYTVITLKRK